MNEKPISVPTEEKRQEGGFTETLRVIAQALIIAVLIRTFLFQAFEIFYETAYIFKRDYERAIVVGRRVVKAVPEFINAYKPVIASLGHLGRRQDAAPYVQKLLSLEPNFTIAKFKKAYPFKLAEDRDNYCKGLLLAGIPRR